MHLAHRCCKHCFSMLFVIAIFSIFILADMVWAADNGVINGSVVNVRSGPGTTYTVVGTLLKGTQVQILQTQGNWNKIQVSSLSGWVSSSLISISPTSTTQDQTTVTTADPPKVILDGKELSFEVDPVIENSRTLVPLRAIFEAMGAAVNWDETTQTVTASKGSKTVVLPLNSTSPTINGVVYPLEVTAKIINNHTLAPLRFVGEAFGGTVSWDAATRIIHISSSPTDATPSAVIVSGSSVNLRSGPSTTYSKVGTASSGEHLSVISQKDGWYQIRQGSLTAWIAGWLVQPASDATETEYEVMQEYIDNNRPGKDGGAPLDPTGQVVHATADPGATAQNIRDYFNNHPEAEASTHAVIDWTSIIEMIPENEIAWHAGPTANSRYLSFEMCEPAADDPDRFSKFEEVWNRAVWYCAKTCVKYGWNTDDNIFSHNGISQMYHETDHTDPYGYFATYGKTWDEFLAGVDAEIAKLN